MSDDRYRVTPQYSNKLDICSARLAHYVLHVDTAVGDLHSTQYLFIVEPRGGYQVLDQDDLPAIHLKHTSIRQVSLELHFPMENCHFAIIGL